MALALLIDTAGEPGCVALSKDGIVVSHQMLPEARRQAALLQPVIAAVCAAAGKTAEDLEAVAVVSGPGSYTGLRVGVAAAKGLCYALDIPLVMPDRLHLLALPAVSATEKQNVWVLLPARAGEWFAGGYTSGTCTVAPRHWEEADLKSYLALALPALILIPEAVATEAHFLKNLQGCQIAYIDQINIEYFAKEANRLIVNKIFESVNKSIPLYLKPAFTTVSTVKNAHF